MRYSFVSAKIISVIILSAFAATSITSSVSAATYSQSDASCRATRPILHPGDRGTCVKLAQQLLAGKGLLKATPNGVYGPATAKAVDDLQHQAGLAPYPQVGPRTWANLLGSSANTGNQSSSPAGVPSACLSAGRVICVQKHGGSSATIWGLQDRKIVYGPTWATTGDGKGPGYATPEGTRYVTKKVQNYWSHEYNAPMPYSVFFYPGVAVHKGDKTPSGGCVHAPESMAINLYNFAVPNSTKVTVTR